VAMARRRNDPISPAYVWPGLQPSHKSPVQRARVQAIAEPASVFLLPLIHWDFTGIATYPIGFPPSVARQAHFNLGGVLVSPCV